MLTFAAAVTLALSAAGFHPIGNHDGVEVYRRDGNVGIELGAEGDLPASPERVRAVLLDYQSHPKWVRHLAESRVLDRGEDSLDVYQRLALPLISDRDFTLHVTWGASPEGLWIRFAAVTDRGPAPKPGIVRVTVHEGSWMLRPIDGGRATHAVYRFHLDLGGSLPGWMSKGRAGKDLPHLFDAIRHQLAYYH